MSPEKLWEALRQIWALLALLGRFLRWALLGGAA